MTDIKPSEITPEHLYLSRRQFIVGAATLVGGALVAACSPTVPGESEPGAAPTPTPGVDELNDQWTSYQDITNYNNFYEFSMDKENVASRTLLFKVSPWSVQVGGLVSNPRTYAVEDLLKRFPPEDRIYRLRCVEAWSMVIPWQGFPLGSLLKEVEPTSRAKFVRFQTLQNPDQMPEQNGYLFDWPYVEGLRLDEAMHPLTLLATGLYGKPTLSQNGAPIRLVVPWKYGFKSIKSIVKIDLVEERPVTFWMAANPQEYGFYANVNPEVPHPRWSQASERRIGETSRRKTLMFNGYADQVAGLYSGMDLRVNF